MANLKFDFVPDTYALAEEINTNFQRVEQQDIFGENLSAQLNGANLIISFAYPVLPGTLRVYLDGLRLTPVVDYTEGVQSFTLLFTAPESGATLVVDYRQKY